MTNMVSKQEVYKNIKAVIFDIDGTIMDSVPRIVTCLQDACKAYNLEIPEKHACRNVIGLSLPKAIKSLIPNESEEMVEKVTEHYRVNYTRLETEKPTQLFMHAVELFTALKEKGYKIGIATGKSRKGFERVLQKTRLGEFVDVAVTGDEVRSKPDQEMLLSIADKMLLPVKAILMVGDSVLDLEMAKRARMYSVGVLTGVHDEETLNSASPIAIYPSLAPFKEELFK
ncbi:MAG: HAD-IA family hydrolase [Succinivibrio sp.]|nr:HAD-IA family hydrolase [Succinivibrio sp.]MDY5780030.1 HAD-IA family hydrolase [Succinivibrionaceae bacterium]